MFLSDIVGASDFHDGHTDHVAGIVAQGDILTIRLTAPSADFLRRLTLPYFCPLPVGTPTVPGGIHSVVQTSFASGFAFFAAATRRA